MAELWPRGVPPPIALRREFQGLLGRARCGGWAGGNFAMARGPQTRAASSIWPNRNSARRWRLKTPFPARCMPNPPWTDSPQSALAGTSGALKPSSMQAAAHAIRGGIRWRNHAGTPLIGLPDPLRTKCRDRDGFARVAARYFFKKIGTAQNFDVARWGAFHTRTCVRGACTF